jgi:hypothetical protein
MANEISDAVIAAEKELPSDLTWKDAFKSHTDATLELWEISGKVGANDFLTSTDHLRLADKILKQQTSSKEENTMTNEVADNMFDEANRPFLILAQKYRAKLQTSDTEDLFSIARRLRAQFEAKKAEDAAKKPAPPDADRFAGNRPGWRLPDAKNGKDDDETNSWEHDRRKRQSTKHVRPEENDEPEKAQSDSIDEYRARISDEWRTPTIIEDERRKKRWQERDPQGREAGSGEEETETDADCNAEYEARQRDAWKTLK